MVRLSEVSSSWLEDGASSVVVSGEWLRRFGFVPGRRVIVDVTEGQIVIKLIEAEDSDGVEVQSYASSF
jgi:hypothetical protein